MLRLTWLKRAIRLPPVTYIFLPPHPLGRRRRTLYGRSILLGNKYLFEQLYTNNFYLHPDGPILSIFYTPLG